MIKKSLIESKRKLTELRNRVLVAGKPKIFCIGRNKTGTTSVKQAFSDLGFIVGDQKKAERLAPYYHRGNFEPIIKYCRTAQVFQDVPFSWPETYKVLDRAFPDAKFILTLRDSAEQWYQSTVHYKSVLYGGGNLPTAAQLKTATYVWDGWVWENDSRIYGVTEEAPFHKETLINHYNNYNEEVTRYFRGRPEKLLVINLAEPDSYRRFCRFLNISSPYHDFPWVNHADEVTPWTG